MHVITKFVALFALGGGLLALGLAESAWSHGGQYRGPGDGIPPGQREPGDPEPPEPPPPSGAPVTPPATPSPGPQPGPTTPTPLPSPPTSGGKPVASGGSTRRGGATLSYENWVFWYHRNKADIENLKRALYTRSTTDNPIHVIGGGNLANRSDATHDTAALVQTDILPALLRTMRAPEMHQDTRSATYIALAKMATDPRHIELLKAGLDLSRKPENIVQESAAIALGLLRRGRTEDRFSAAELDRVRTFLFSVFENEDYQSRTRSFAALAIGLLGDQPSHGSDGPARITAHLFSLLSQHASFRHPDLVLSLLLAIGLQPAPSVLTTQKALLRSCLARGTLHKATVTSLTQSYVALTLGRIGDETDIAVLQRAMTSRRNKDRNIRRSCAIGLGQLGRHVQGSARVQVADCLLQAARKLKDASVRNFAIISLSDLLIADVQANRTDVIDNTDAGSFLLETADRGRYLQRPFAALALGLVGRAISDKVSINVYGEFRGQAIEALRNGLGTKKIDKRARGAFATALGILKDPGSIQALVALVRDQKEDPELRGYAALGLGLIGVATPNVLRPIRSALRERRSTALRQQMATALGLLQDRKAIPLLLTELKQARSQAVKGQVVLALARIGDARAVAPLVQLLDDKQERDLTRALACAGLGVIGDLQWLPSLSRISLDVNYRASTDVLNEVLSLI